MFCSSPRPLPIPIKGGSEMSAQRSSAGWECAQSLLLPASEGPVDVPTQGGELVGVEELVNDPSSPSSPY